MAKSNSGRLRKLVRGPLAGAVSGAAASSMPGKLKGHVEARTRATPMP